jgi:IclR family KDG regulon transcriptional repressor
MKRSNYRPKYPVQTLEKAMDVLLYMVNHPNEEGITITEIAENTNDSKSGVHRILDTFLSYRIVEKLPSAQTYRLGWGLYEMGLAVPTTSNLLSTNYSDIMSSLCEQLGETINLGICSDDEIVMINKREPDSRLRVITTVGSREPLHYTALGKTFLAELSDQEIREYYATHEIVPKTETSIVTADAMITELTKVRKTGYAMDCGEFEEGLLCIAMPIRDYTGGVVAAMSVSGQALRMTQEKIDRVVPLLRQAVTTLSLSLGHKGAVQDIYRRS